MAYNKARNGCSTIVLALLLYFSVAVCGTAFCSIYSPIHSLKQTSLFQSPTAIPADGDDIPAPSSKEEDAAKKLSQEISRGGSDDALPTLPMKVKSLPTLKDFRNFAIPCLGLWVSGPLLSLVDTAFVGLSGPSSQSSAQLAALGPATTFFDGATFLFAFLNVATTNLYASARAKSGEKSDEAEGVVRTASRVALNCGLVVMALLLVYSKPLIALYIGEPAASTPNLLKSATDYVRIRALSMPTTLLLNVLQAALLGAKDSVTPVIAILYSTVVNLVGDFILVNRLKMGLQGAAIATLLAQLTATAALVLPARQRLIRDHNLGLFNRKSTTSSSISGRTFLKFAAPVLTLILGKMAAFGFMTHSAAAVPGQPTPLASHQIILSLFFFVSPFLEVLSQTAQTFIPPYLAPVSEYVEKMKKIVTGYEPNQDASVQKWHDTAYVVATRLLGIGMIVAVAIASVASLIPAFFGGMITSDATVQNAVKPLAKYLWIGSFLTAPVAISEGVLLANRELGFLATIYVVSTLLLPPALLRIKHAGGTVAQIWGCFAAFQLFRAICFAGKIWGGELILHLKRKGKPASPTPVEQSSATA